MKNKIVVAVIIISFVLFFAIMVIKSFPEINLQYNSVLTSIHHVGFTSAFTICLFAVFGYSLLTYIMAYVSYIGLYSVIVKFLKAYNMIDSLPIGFERVIMYGSCLVLTILTFYILKKCKININVPANKKEV